MLVGFAPTPLNLRKGAVALKAHPLGKQRNGAEELLRRQRRGAHQGGRGGAGGERRCGACGGAGDGGAGRL